MSAKPPFKHGFKAECERVASKYRNELKIHACGFLDAFALANHLNIKIYQSREFLHTDHEVNLLSGQNGDSCGWSALTMITKAGNQIIIHNEYNTPQRQQSDIMHELAHIICGHKHEVSDYGFNIPIGMREYNEIHEEEAKWLGATLQLSKPCLLWARKYNKSNEEVAKIFNCSVEMVIYRMRVTNIGKKKHPI